MPKSQDTPNPPRNDERPLPDGWIQPPVPTIPRDEPSTGGWFERTGEPAPPRVLAEGDQAGDHSFAQMVLWGGVLLALLFAILVLVL